jgi:uncharacterized membrane protein
MLHRATPERLSFFSDAIFAVLITVCFGTASTGVPYLQDAAAALAAWLSYLVSYLFIAIVWTKWGSGSNGRSVR